MLHVAFLWHMHQPSYRDPVSGKVMLPWVRLHGVKDYSDMALALATPGARSTVNWVPGLLDQCDAVGHPDHPERERFWRLTLTPADALSPDDVGFIRRHFFSLGAPMLEPHARYRELRDMVRADRPLSHDELRDLQVWFNLAWTGIAVRQEHPEVAALFARGRDFTEADKHTLLDAQRQAVLALPGRWRTLAESGRVELTTSPHYHPILPLLIDTDLARVAAPSTALPDARFRMPQDARAQLQRALDAHERRFGSPTRGLWPSEGAVAEPLLPIVQDLGVQWLATDESILWKSLGTHTDSAAKFAPWTLSKDGQPGFARPSASLSNSNVRLVFRDHGLSDKIGFVYASWPAERAYTDFVDALTTIERATRHTGDDHLVLIALDGENCWEHYPGGVTQFLPGLLDRIAHTPNLRLSTVSEAIAAVPARTLPTLAPGSWVDGTFGTWIGDPVKNRAWDLLTAARQAVATQYPQVLTDPAHADLADLVLRAEASDWWWWFGEGHSSTFDMDFDALFRSHLIAIWQALDRPVPPELRESLSAGGQTRAAPSQENRPTDARWTGEVQRTFGSTHRAQSLITRLRYGHDADALYLALEGHAPLESALADLKVELALNGPNPQTLTLWPADPPLESTLGDRLETKIPRAALDSSPRLYASLTVSRRDGPVERFPDTGDIELVLNPDTGA